ncbi:sensor histidine kinase [Mariniflexile sp. AS56]|uniref:sensor histidine kinase n=1 Tax=Mariniflexile sp. AS56 TaxID=3063957 RepID=UPI0026EC43E2|nr:sensor histidine kinase [Mariniflexile sp. AS56]MDO7171944.1 PAS domain S-box protein [Mariniflexile sp. AS56]
MPESLSLIKDKLFENIFNFAHGGIAILSTKGKWIKVNQSVVKCLGYSEEELYQLSFQDITHKDDLDSDLGHMRSLISGKTDNYQIEKRYFRKNGSIVWTLLSVSLVRDVDGRPLYFISQIHDISKQNEDKSRLGALLRVAKEQNNRLSSFADIITHNLRTHASNLLTLFDFIEEEYQLLVKGENFGLLKESINNLDETVSHLAEVAKIKSIEECKIESLNLSVFVRHALYNVSALAKNINCTIENHICEHHKVKAVPAFLDSIILNFLTNAIKYRSDCRGCIIKLSSEIINEFVVFHIEDNGLGIDLEKYGDNLFQMYKTFHRNKDALGVGLFITKNHIESLGGCVDVKSEVDKGTTFSVYLKSA